MTAAVDRLGLALDRGETILVHGDYDVDGMTSTAILTRVLRGLGGQVVPFVPYRLTDGYDLGPAGVAAAMDAGATLVVTCDCGTSAHAAVDALRAAGIDCIITDHHLPGGPLPAALTVLNPRRPGCPSPDKDLVAAGVVYFTSTAFLPAINPMRLFPHAAVSWAQLLFATPVVLWAGWPFFVRGWHSVVNRSLNMFTLIALGTGAAWIFSVVATVLPGALPASFRDETGAAPLYFEAAAVMSVLRCGVCASE